MSTNQSTGSELDLDDTNADGPQIVTFSLSGERFAVPMESVQEIVRVPDTVRVPLASSHLMGLANLRGRVLPVFQCRTMLGMDPVEATEASRVLVLRVGTSVGLMVDRVHAVMTVSPGQIDTLRQDEEVSNREWLAGVVRQEKDLTLLLDVDRLVQVHAIQSAGAQLAGAQGNGFQDVQGEEQANLDELQLVSFEVAGQEYAAPIEQVQEIVQAPSEYTLLPHTPEAVLGVMVLRNRLLPLLSLRALFGLEVLGLQEHHRVVVLQLANGSSVGVVMDRVNEVLRVPKSIQEPVPALFQQTGAVRHVQSMCRLDEGKRLVSILAIDSMASFANVAMERMGNLADDQHSIQQGNAAEAEMDETEDDGQVVVFHLGAEEFGVNIHSVQEIVRVPEQLTRIPKAPEFMEGVINLRGSVLPVIDQRRRMGIEAGERSDRQRIMVYLMNGIRTGFIVDSVTEVLRIDAADISDTPGSGLHDVALLPKVANLTDSKRMILLIDPNALLSHAEADLAATATNQKLNTHSFEPEQVMEVQQEEAAVQ